ncbi:hypothetical protein ACFXMT_48675 [Streptomyces mirabilis]|uniref:hypothetical protein n=1 Tax=Streptomyces mirabilis TaxID=68239 RepID=UPI0036904AED
MPQAAAVRRTSGERASQFTPSPAVTDSIVRPVDRTGVTASRLISSQRYGAKFPKAVKKITDDEAC